MNFRRHARREAGFVIPKLPLVAFIDVVLFLLLYLVFASDLMPPEAHLASALRTSSGQGRAANLLPQILYVEGAAGRVRYRLGDRVMETRGALQAVLGKLPRDAGLVVRVSNDVPVGAAAAAVSAAKQAGFGKISYVPGK